MIGSICASRLSLVADQHELPQRRRSHERRVAALERTLVSQQRLVEPVARDVNLARRSPSPEIVGAERRVDFAGGQDLGCESCRSPLRSRAGQEASERHGVDARIEVGRVLPEARLVAADRPLQVVPI